MSGFFYDIRSFFSSRFSGRYLSLLLRELARREPASFAAIFNLPSAIRLKLCRGELQVEREIRFEGLNGKLRIADLVLLSVGEPIVYFEIKEDDVKHPANAAQLNDYVAAIRLKRDRATKHFIHVSRYLPPDGDRKILKDARSVGLQVADIRYRDIHRVMSRLSNARKLEPLSRIVFEYLEDLGVASYQQIDLSPNKGGRQLAFLLTQVLGFPHSHNFGRLHSDAAIDGVPNLFRTIIANLEFLGEWIRKSNLTLFRQRFTRKFTPRVYYDLSSLAKAVNKMPHIRDATEGPLPGGSGQFVQSGSVTFYAQSKFSSRTTAKLSGSNWLYIEVGFEFLLEKGEKDDSNNPIINTSVYALFYWNGCKDEPTVARRQISFPSERKMMSELNRCLQGALKRAMKQAPASHRQSLRRFKIPDSEKSITVI